MSNEIIIKAIVVAIIMPPLVWVTYHCIHAVWILAFGKMHFVRKAVKKLGLSKEELLTPLAWFSLFLNKVERICRENGYSVKFSMFCPRPKMGSQGFGTNCRTKIKFGPVWIYLIAVSPRLSELAFVQSVGHEIGHRFDWKKGKGFYFRPAAERRLFYWLQEIKSDFWGVDFTIKNYEGVSRKTILNAVGKKAERYIKERKRKECMSHPSWELRCKLLKEHNCFDEEVVRKVAKAAGCDMNSDWVKHMECCARVTKFI